MVDESFSLIDVTDIFQDYRTCCRDIWNLYLQRGDSIDAWVLLEDFKNAKAILFKLIVYNRSLARVEQHIGCGDGLEFLVVPSVHSSFGSPGAPIRISEVDGPRGGSFWNQDPKYVRADEITLSYIDICDWGDTKFRDMSLYRVEILEMLGHPELKNRHAMLEASYVNIVAKPRHERLDGE